jgi:hypothetical protein
METATRQENLNAVLQRKVNAFVERSKVDAESLLEKLKDRTIQDWVFRDDEISFDTASTIPFVYIRGMEKETPHIWRMNPHSAYQVADRIGLPQTWISKSITGVNYQRDAAAYALNQYMENYKGNDNRFLMRTVDDTLRGFLSTSYKRLNTREIFMMFVLTATKLGLPLVGAFEGGSRDYLEILNPSLTWVDTPNNGLVAYARGMQLKNSDFGDGYLELRAWGLYGACLNGNTGKHFLKEIHLGARVAEDVMFSIETINHDTETRALMVRDAMEYVFSPENQEYEAKSIQKASETEVDLKDEIHRLPQIGITKTEAKSVEEILLKHDPEDGINGKPSKFMVAQAISALARTTDPGRMREMQRVAGSLIFIDNPPRYLELKD